MTPLDLNPAFAEQALTAQRALAAALARELCAPLAELVARDPDAASAGLSAAILRIVFLLHAEDRGLLGPGAARPVSAVLDRLHAEAEPAGAAPSAWAELAAIFRATIHQAPARGQGAERLLDPDADPFLDAPVDDATVARILESLLIHNGARVAYRTLDLEGIGGIYEALIGLGFQVTTGASIALRPDHTLIDLDALLALAPELRESFLADAARVELGARAGAALRAACSPADLTALLRKRISPLTPALIPRGAIALAATAARRRSGSHYTPPALTRALVQATLAPLLGDRPDPARLLELTVCDPAMGSGAFLLEVCRFLGDRLLEASGQAPAGGEAAAAAQAEARRQIAERCLHGVDKDPLAVDLCRISLWLLTRAPGSPRGFLGDKLLCGDSLIGAGRADLEAFPAHAFQRDDVKLSVRAGCALSAPPDAEAPEPLPRDPEALARCLDAWTALWFWPTDDPEAAALAPTRAAFSSYLAAAASAVEPLDPAARQAASLARRARFLHWEAAFPAVFSRELSGFDAIVGNPPWVAYAGRAAQPLASATFNFYRRRSPAFFGYRTLHGLFIHRAATLLRPGGRLGLIVPTSVSDLQGYAPARAAHDRFCEPDPALPDFGADAFDGVFQPAMGLLSTRRAAPAPRALAAWRLVRSELTSEAERLLHRLAALAPLPASLFGERGYQTMGDDASRLKELDGPEPPFTIPLREGRDIGPYRRRPPRIHLDPRGIEPRIRPASDWRDVKLLIRQTARYPIAALGDGQPFRNSVLAGFASEEHSAFFLLCYLNSTPIRWFHFTRYRDARQGMPQVKIAHLRGLPAPPGEGAGRGGEPQRGLWKAELEAIGQALGERNQGIGDEAAAIDARVAALLELSDAELALVRAWAVDNPLPRSSYG